MFLTLFFGLRCLMHNFFHLRPIHAGALVITGLAVLSGCAQQGLDIGSGLTFWADNQAALQREAENTSAASLKLDITGRSGLAILGAQSGDMTFWAFGSRRLVSLYQGGIQSSSGFEADLLATRYFLDTTAPDEMADNGDVPWQTGNYARYQLERHWIDDEGNAIAMRADGEMSCQKTTQTFNLVLARDIELQPCSVNYTWQNGQTTQAQWWRTPQTARIWKASEQLWPDGPEASWEVARPWWSES